MLVVDTWAGSPITDEVQNCEGDNVIFQSSRVKMRSDNLAVVSAINYGREENDFLGIGMRYVHFQMALRDCNISLSYVNTKENTYADGLSRGDTQIVNSLKA